jgi:integrase
MFPTSTGTLIEAVALGKRFRLVLRKAGLPAFRLYDLRHTYATHLLAEEASITYVAAQLGHARPTTTLALRALDPAGQQGLDRASARSSRGGIGKVWHQIGVGGRGCVGST